jgi:hypothetical protein
MMENMEHEDQRATDPLDRASAEADAANQEAIRNHQLRVAASGDLPAPAEGGNCVEPDCMMPVEPARLALGLGRCLDCANAHERARLRRVRGY